MRKILAVALAGAALVALALPAEAVKRDRTVAILEDVEGLAGLIEKPVKNKWSVMFRARDIDRGDYAVLIQTGKDLTGDGHPDAFQLHPVCEFDGRPHGCRNARVDVGGIEDFGPFDEVLLLEYVHDANGNRVGSFVLDRGVIVDAE